MKTINSIENKLIIVVHGTDTMDLNIDHLVKNDILMSGKTIVFTGAMKPFSIDQIEATANLSMVYGFLQACREPSIYISMNGLIDHFSKIKKDKKLGRFVVSKS